MNFDDYLEKVLTKLINDVIPRETKKDYSDPFKICINGQKVKDTIHKQGSHFRYYVMEDGKTIYADLSCSTFELLTDAGLINFTGESGMFSMKKYYLRPYYRGKAVCNDEDSFDLEYGMKLARTRALKLYYADRQKKIQKYLDEVKKVCLAPAVKQFHHAFCRLKELDSDIEDSWHY